MSSLNPFPQELKNSIEEKADRLYKPEMIAAKETTSRHNRTGVHIHSQRLWQHAQGAYRGSSKMRVPVLRGAQC